MDQIEQIVDEINQGGYGFRIERPGSGWGKAPWVAIDKQTGQATPLTNRAVILKHQQLGLSVAARTLGRKGGSARSERKVAASRANGRLGGRPPGVLTTRSRIEARWTSDPADLENREPIPGSPEAVGSPKQVFAAVREYRRKIGSAFCRVEYRHHGRILTCEEIADLETAVMLAGSRDE